ncbi:MAG: transporter [Acidobacteria bacterium]|nr:transporter [Acidobacteriota bacterium]
MRFGCALLLAAAAAAQTETPAGLGADGPAFAVGTEVVPRGILQLETGMEYAIDHEDGRRVSAWSHGETLARLGVWRRLELRFSTGGFERSHGEAGWGDTGLGAKLLLFEEARHRPALALVPEVSVPVGQARFGGGSWQSSLAVTCSKYLRRWNLGGMFQSGPERAAGVYGIHALGRAATFSAEAWHEGEAWSAAAGFTREVGASLELDVSAGRHLGSGPPSCFILGRIVLRGPSAILGKTPARFRSAFR